jgi:hypothetical protein
MKRLVLALATIGLISAVTGSAYAAKPAPPAKPPQALDAKNIEKGKADAPGVITAGNLQCQLANATWHGGSTQKIDKKNVKYDVYELACTGAPGIMAKKFETGTVETFDCIKAKAAFDAEPGKGNIVCVLPENADLGPQVQGMFNKAGGQCQVSKFTYIGTRSSTKGDLYEIACTQGPGYVFEANSTSSQALKVTSCLRALAVTGKECTLTPKEVIQAQLNAYAAAADKSCQVSNSRWVGANDKGDEYYEFACGSAPGFMTRISNGAVAEKFDCVRAATIGDGCKLTDLSTAKKGAASGYAGLLQSKGITCNPTDVRIVGSESGTNRDVIEIVCPERPFGLMILNPKAGSTASFRSFDCIGAKQAGIECQLMKKEEVLAKLKPILTAVGKTCDPTDYRVSGPGDTDGEVIEVKCSAGQEGYVIDVPANRAKTIKTLSCTQAARGIDPCTLPGNK